MQILEYGEKKNAAVLLVHGIACDGDRSFSEVIRLLSRHYRVIVPLLDGYDHRNTTFTSISDQACQIYQYLKEHGVTQLYAALGMSMGGFICIELFSNYPVETKKLILDSGYMNNLPVPKMVAGIISYGFCILMKGQGNIVLDQGMKKMMGYCVKKEDLYPATRRTIYNSELSCLTYKLPANLKRIHVKEIAYWVGRKEKYMIQGMHSLKKRLPHMKQICVGNVGHGEIMFTDQETYANRILKSLNHNNAIHRK